MQAPRPMSGARQDITLAGRRGRSPECGDISHRSVVNGEAQVPSETAWCPIETWSHCGGWREVAVAERTEEATPLTGR